MNETSEIERLREELECVRQALPEIWRGSMPSVAVATLVAESAALKDAAQETVRLRAALLTCARKAEALKRECGMDPESPQALRNAQYQSISTTAHIALRTIRGPEGA